MRSLKSILINCLILFLFFFAVEKANASKITDLFNAEAKNFSLPWLEKLPPIWPDEFNYMAKRTEYLGLKNPKLHQALFEKVKGNFLPYDALWAMVFCKDDQTCYKILDRVNGKFSWSLYDFYKLTRHRPGLKRLRELVAKRISYIKYDEQALYAHLKGDEFPLAWELAGKHCGLQYEEIDAESFRKYAFKDARLSETSHEISFQSGLSEADRKKLCRKYDNIRRWVLAEKFPVIKKIRKVIINGVETANTCPSGMTYCSFCGYTDTPDKFLSNAQCPQCQKPFRTVR